MKERPILFSGPVKSGEPLSLEEMLTRETDPAKRAVLRQLYREGK